MGSWRWSSIDLHRFLPKDPAKRKESVSYKQSTDHAIVTRMVADKRVLQADTGN